MTRSLFSAISFAGLLLTPQTVWFEALPQESDTELVEKTQNSAAE